MKITKRTAIGVTLIVLIGLTSWGLADTLTEQHYIDADISFHCGATVKSRQSWLV
jgi:hypothetical protein